jgi:DNA-binding transcriptional ArsR family regulator
VKAADAVVALAALAQEHRLALFRLLVQAGEEGMAAGAIASALGVPNSSLSFHLAQLTRAGLIRQERRSRSIIYRADYEAMNALMGYLMENCCAGAACAPAGACGDAATTVQPERKSA